MRVSPDQAEIIMFDGRVRLRNPQGELLVASGDAAVSLRGRRRSARSSPGRAMRSPGRSIIRRCWRRSPGRSRRPSLPPGLRRAVERVAANDYAGALQALDEVPEAARDARYFTYRAGVLLNVGRVEQAAAAIARALALDPDAADALAERAVIAVVQNRRKEALADARRAVELAPELRAGARSRCPTRSRRLSISRRHARCCARRPR